jgi:hypothetical protein
MWIDTRGFDDNRCSGGSGFKTQCGLEREFPTRLYPQVNVILNRAGGPVGVRDPCDDRQWHIGHFALHTANKVGTASMRPMAATAWAMPSGLSMSGASYRGNRATS